MPEKIILSVEQPQPESIILPGRNSTFESQINCGDQPETTLSEQERIDNLKAWFRANGWNYRKLSIYLDIALTNVHRILHAAHIRPERVAQLRQLGVPDNLLPESRYTPPGPRPKSNRKAS